MLATVCLPSCEARRRAAALACRFASGLAGIGKMPNLTYKRKGVNVRPMSRTLTKVYENMLEDVVGCADIVNTRGENTWAAMGRVQVGRYVAVPAQYSRDEGRAACRTMGYHDLASIHSAEDQRNAAAACASRRSCP